jgi:hypothetical protein
MHKPGGRAMDNYSERIIAFRLAMSMANTMLKRGIISNYDYKKIQQVMAEKYGISLSSIFLT